MTDDILVNKAASIERAVRRAREEYQKDPAGFATNYTFQDAAILNIQRACEALIDMGQHIVRRDRLGVPQSARDVFTLLAQQGRISGALSDTMKSVVGFRNVAVHDYQALQLPITRAILERHLDDLLEVSRLLLQEGEP